MCGRGSAGITLGLVSNAGKIALVEERMLAVIEKKSEVKRLQNIFEEELKKNFAKSMDAMVGVQQGPFKCKLHHNGKIWFSTSYDKERNKFWNAFGRDPKENNNSITVEVGIPDEGINRRIGGVFAKDENGHEYLLHRGIIGGQRGFGKENFWRFCDLKQVEIKDGDQPNYACIITKLPHKDFIENVTFFIKEVNRIKEEIKIKRDLSGGTVNSFVGMDFDPEFRGRRVGGQAIYVADCSHGRVVDDLRKWVGEKAHHSKEIGNNQLIDLAVVRGHELLEVYEVKSKTDRQSIYTAIGQVMCHANSGEGKKSAKIEYSIA